MSLLFIQTSYKILVSLEVVLDVCNGGWEISIARLPDNQQYVTQDQAYVTQAQQYLTEDQAYVTEDQQNVTEDQQYVTEDQPDSSTSSDNLTHKECDGKTIGTTCFRKAVHFKSALLNLIINIS